MSHETLAAPTAAERFERLLGHACPVCGAGWSSHSLCITEGIGTGLLLCTAGDLLSVHYPEGDVFRVMPVRSEPIDFEAIATAAVCPDCPVCAGELRTAGRHRGRICAACAESGLAALEVGGSLRLLCDGHPVPGLADFSTLPVQEAL